MGFFSQFVEGLSTGYGELTTGLSFTYSSLLNIIVFAVLIALYSLFTFKFYRYLSKKDLISINLSQYNQTTHPFLNKLFAVVLYLLEYIIILPFLIFFWFAILSFILLVISAELSINTVIIISAAMVTAIRILSYYEEDLSKDLAKMFPFTVLTIFILSPGFFSLTRIVDNLKQAPQLLGSIIYFLALIIAVELILRIIDLFLNLIHSKDTAPNFPED